MLLPDYFRDSIENRFEWELKTKLRCDNSLNRGDVWDK